jgi:hypothetical protein
MISVAEAKKIIDENTVALLPVKLSLQQAAGKILADLQWMGMLFYSVDGSMIKN